MPTVDLIKTLNLSLKDLRNSITDCRYGPIIKDKGTILFTFQKKHYIAPEPTELLFGYDPESDKSIALCTLLDKTAKRTFN